MNAATLLLFNGYVIFQLWILALRRTLAWKSVLIFFLAGFYSTSVAALILHFLASRFINPVLGVYTINPAIEEIVKILPVFIFIWGFKIARGDLGILDFMLMALASGTGFEVAEKLFYSSAGIPQTYTFTFWMPQQLLNDHYFFKIFHQSLPVIFAGHGILTAAIGLALGLTCISIYYPRWHKIALGLPVFLLAWAIFDHAMVNYLNSGGLLGMIVRRLNPIQEFFYFLDRAGKLIVYFLTASIFIALGMEEYILTRELKDSSDIRLPGEKPGLEVANEIRLLAKGFSMGWRYLLWLFKLFLVRRQLAYCQYHQTQSIIRPSPEDLRHLEVLKSNILSQLNRLKQFIPAPNPWKIVGLWSACLGSVLIRMKSMTWKSYWLLIYSLAWIVLFVWHPIVLTYKVWFIWLTQAMALAGMLRMVVTYLRFRKVPKPNLLKLDANEAVQFYSTIILLNMGLVLCVLAMVTYFVPVAKIANGWHFYFIWQAFGDFFNRWGGFLPEMLGINAGLIAVLPHIRTDENSRSVPDDSGTSTEEANIAAYQAAIEHALANPMNLPHDGKTFCNSFVSDVASKLGIDELAGKTAHGQYLYVGSHPESWQEVSAVEAQAFANQGKLVVGVAPSPDPENPEKHGHSTVVAPGYEAEETGSGKMPWIVDANKDDPAEPITANWRYFKDNPPKWYCRK